MSEISYSKIVFGIKHRQQLYDCRKFIEQVHSLRIIISEHNAVTDACDRPGLHYHGIIEHGKDIHINGNDAIVQLRTYCTYYKIEKCYDPEKSVVELAQPPKKIMIIEIANSFNLKTYYSTILVAGVRSELGDFKKEVSKMATIKFIIANIETRRTFEIAEIWEEINGCYSPTPDELKTLTHAVDLVHQKMLDQSILALCERVKEMPENYYTVQESTDIVVEWCRYQNIDFEEFTMNWVKCLDKQVSYRNSLYFQGSPESGVINIINSIADACTFVGEIDNETSGYAFVWEKCLEKRCIIMRDPIFDERMFKELKNIFSGIGTCVPHQQSVLKYLRPTPVVVICGEGDERNDLYLQHLEASFLKSYVNLKSYVKLSSDSRRLHPYWLNVLYMDIGHKIDYNTSYSEDTSGRLMDHESSYELLEDVLNSSVESPSNTTPFAGCYPTPNFLQDA